MEYFKVRNIKLLSIVKRICPFLICLIICSSLYGQREPPGLKDYFNTLANSGDFNGAVLVAENGKIVFEHFSGYASFEDRLRITRNTVFPIASLSKTITATAVLQFVKTGRLDVNDPVKKHLNWFPYDNISARHLLSHTSGLPPYNVWFDSLRKINEAKVFTNADFAIGLESNARPLVYTPGEKGNYDNINYIVLAILVEELSGMPFSEYVSKFVLQPAGMTNTRYVPFRVQYNDGNGLPMARPYLFPHRYSDSLVRASLVPYIVKYWSGYDFSGFGDYVSTVTDLLRYDQAYYGSWLLPDEIKLEMFSPVKLNNGKNNHSGFGLGWQVYADTSLGKVVYHGGNATGLSCVLIRNLTRKQTIIIFDNIHSDNSYSLGLAALKLLNDVPVPLPKKSLAAVYGRVLVKDGADVARKTFMELKKDTAKYYISEDEMNLLGYDFLGGPYHPNPYKFPEEHKYNEAVETFRLNTELFPDSWNVYDSYGESLLKVGRKDEAAAMYKKSIRLNPKNEDGKKILEKILKEKAG